MSTDEPTADQPGTRERLEAERESLEAEIARLRAGGQASPAQLRALERDLASLRSQLATLSAQNERLVRTLRDAREQIVTLKSEVDRLAQPPAAYGIVIEVFDGGTADILTSGRKMHVAVSPSIEQGSLVPGREVMLNEAMNVVAAHGYETTGRGRALQGDPRRRSRARRGPGRRGAGVPRRGIPGRHEDQGR